MDPATNTHFLKESEKISNGARQRTIKEPVRIGGAGLQTGEIVTLSIKGSPANSGINFIRLDLPNKPLLNIQSLDKLGMTLKQCRKGQPVNFTDTAAAERRTTLELGPFQVQTTEHLLSAIAGLSIDNIVLELDNVELPGLDGSAFGFLEAIKKAGIVEQDAPKKILKISEPVWCADANSLLAVFPDDDLRISYTLSYDSPAIGTQFFSIAVNEKSFEKEIAPARTFCLEEEAIMLLKQGFGRGANYDNTLVMGKSGPVKNALRFPNEPVRHKILDLVGDLSLLGMPLKGHVIAIKSGHALNMELVKRLKDKIQLTQSVKRKAQN